MSEILCPVFRTDSSENLLQEKVNTKIKSKYKLLQLFGDDKILYTDKDKQSIISIYLEDFPEKSRKKFWFIASGAKREMLNFPNYYHNILYNYPDYIPSIYEQTIEKDLNRTFPEEEFFQKKENIDKLRNILLAFSRRNSSIGYNQGFNFMVGRILEIVEDEVRYNNYILFIINLGKNILDILSIN